jgi:hypothetical protein
MQARSGEKMLHAACACGDFPLALFFLDKGAKVEEMDGYGEYVRAREREAAANGASVTE